jgi:hypothetical protein
MSRTGRRRVDDGIPRRAWHGWLSQSLLREVEEIARRRNVSVGTVVEDALAYGVAGFRMSEALCDGLGHHPALDRTVELP